MLGTNTSENRKVIKPQNGVVVGETADNFYAGLKSIFKNRRQLDSAKIRIEAMGYTLEDIVRKNLLVYLSKIRAKW